MYIHLYTYTYTHIRIYSQSSGKLLLTHLKTYGYKLTLRLAM